MNESKEGRKGGREEGRKGGREGGREGEAPMLHGPLRHVGEEEREGEGKGGRERVCVVCVSVRERACECDDVAAWRGFNVLTATLGADTGTSRVRHHW